MNGPRSRQALAVLALCALGVVLLLAGCSTLGADSTPPVDSATLEMRSNP